MTDIDQITPQQVAERFDSLPKSIQDAASSTELLQAVAQICLRQGLADGNDVLLVQQLSGLVLLGFLKPAELSEQLDVLLTLGSLEVAKMATDLDREIFSKYRADLEKIYQLPSVETPATAPAQPVVTLSAPATTPLARIEEITRPAPAALPPVTPMGTTRHRPETSGSPGDLPAVNLQAGKFPGVPAPLPPPIRPDITRGAVLPPAVPTPIVPKQPISAPPMMDPIKPPVVSSEGGSPPAPGFGRAGASGGSRVEPKKPETITPQPIVLRQEEKMRPVQMPKQTSSTTTPGLSPSGETDLLRGPASTPKAPPSTARIEIGVPAPTKPGAPPVPPLPPLGKDKGELFTPLENTPMRTRGLTPPASSLERPAASVPAPTPATAPFKKEEFVSAPTPATIDLSQPTVKFGSILPSTIPAAPDKSGWWQKLSKPAPTPSSLEKKLAPPPKVVNYSEEPPAPKV